VHLNIRFATAGLAVAAMTTWVVVSSAQASAPPGPSSQSVSWAGPAAADANLQAMMVANGGTPSVSAYPGGPKVSQPPQAVMQAGTPQVIVLATNCDALAAQLKAGKIRSYNCTTVTSTAPASVAWPASAAPAAAK
jgi:hypothetical protein